MKKIGCCLIGILLSLLFMTSRAVGEESLIQEPEAKIVKVIKYVEVEEDFRIKEINDFFDSNIPYYTLEELQTKIAEERETQKQAHELAELARALGWPEECDAIQLAKIQWTNAQKKIDVYSIEYDFKYQELDLVRWDEKKKEYPIATEIWLYMKNLGWNDYVCAGIMGNLMAECGGQTLNIQPLIQGTYYGMCQWSKVWYPEVWGQDLQGQLDFLNKTIENEFSIFGYLYRKGFTFSQFLGLTNEKDAALAFAKCYERCHHNYYAIRQTNAAAAYNYFVNS